MDKIENLSLAELTQAEWDSFVSTAPDALPFHTREWANLLASVYDVRTAQLGIWANDQMCGALPLWHRCLGPFALGGSPLMQTIASTPYAGALGEDIPIGHLLPPLNQYAQAHRLAYVELSLPTLLPRAEIAAAEACGYQHETCNAVVLSLQREVDRLWNGLSSGCRRAVRKARSRGVEVVEPLDASFLPAYCAMVEEVYQQAGRLAHLSAFFHKTAWVLLRECGTLKVLLAYCRGDLLAGAMFVIHNDYAYYLSSASTRAGLAQRPNNLLQWHFVRWAAQNGVQTYDMGGAVVPGITRFKLSFGGSIHAYSRLYRSTSLVAKVGRSVYARGVPIVRRLQRAMG